MKSNLYKKDLITTRFAGKLSGYTSSYLRRLARSGEIEGVQVGRVWMIKRSSLVRFLDVQAKRKEELSHVRSQVRAAEYHSHRPPLRRPAKTITKPLSASYFGTKKEAIIFASILTFIVISFGTVALQGASIVPAVITAGKQTAAVVGMQSVSGIGEKLALATYETVQSFFDSAQRALASLFKPSSTLVVLPSPPPTVIASNPPPVHSAFTTIVATTTRPSYTTIVQGISSAFLDQSLSTLRADIIATVVGMVNPVAAQVNPIYHYSEADSFDGGAVGNAVTAPSFSASDAEGMNSLALLTAGTTTLTNLAVTNTSTSTFAGPLSVAGVLTVTGTTTAAGFISTDLGSAERPAFAFLADLATGLFSPTASTLALSSGGTERLRIDADGNVGIGTTSPDALLSLQQVTNGTPFLSAYRVTDTVPSGDFISYKQNDGTTLFRVDNSGNLLAGGIINSGSQTITSVSTPQFRVQYDPTNEITLSVNSLGTTTIGLNGTAPGLTFTPQSNLVNQFNFTDKDSSSVLSIDTVNKRVGVGTTSPYAKLSVVGPIIAEYFHATSSVATSTFSGKVGVGTANPARKVHIVDGTSYGFGFGEQLRVDGSNTVGANIGFYTSLGGDRRNWLIGTDVATVGDFGFVRSASPGTEPLSSLVSLVINNAGNVGIGTTSPWAQLSVNPNGITGPAFAIGSSTKTDFVVTNGGKVGVGTAAPAYPLHITGTSDTGHLAVEASGGIAQIQLLGNAGSADDINFGISGGTFANAPGKIRYNNGSSGLMQFYTNSEARLNITNTGNVGIGTTTPQSKLSVVASEATNAAISLSADDGDDISDTWFLNSIASGNTLTFTNSGNTAFSLSGFGALSLPQTTAQVTLYSSSDSTGLDLDVRASSLPTASYIYTADGSGGSYPFTTWGNLLLGPASGADIVLGRDSEVVIKDGGNVGIGTTSPGHKLSVAGSAYFDGGTITASGFTATSSISAPYFTTTDATATSTFAGFIDVNGTGSNATSTFASNLWVKGTLRTGTGSIYLNDTGLTASDGNIALTRNGVSHINGGNVGIGTTTPVGKLTVASSGGVNTGLTLDISSASSYVPIDFRSQSTLGAQIAMTGSSFSSGSSGANELFVANELTSGTLHLASIGSSGIVKFTTGGNTTANERMRITSDGNVGIGTTNPTAGHLVVGDGTTSSNQAIVMNSPAANWAGIVTQKAGTEKWFIGMGDTATYGDKLLLRRTASSNDMVIDTSGNVGIGTASPGSKLHAYDSSTASNRVAQFTNAVDANGEFSYIGIGRESGEQAYVGHTYNSTDGNRYAWLGVSGDGITENGTGLIVKKGGNVGIGTATPNGKLAITPSSVGTRKIVLFEGANNDYQFYGFGVEGSTLVYTTYTTSDDHVFFAGTSATSRNELMRIKGTGNVGIGTANPGYKLDVSGSLNATSLYENGIQVSYPIPLAPGANNCSAQWVNLGTLTIGQGGQSAFIKMVSNAGYNASISQNFEAYIRFKTSNGGSVDSNGFAGDSSFYTTGRSLLNGSSAVKWVANASGVSATSYTLYVNFASCFGVGSFYTVETSGGSWVDVSAGSQSDPGSGSATVLIATNEFNVGGSSLVVNSSSNVGIGTADPGAKLEVFDSTPTSAQAVNSKAKMLVNTNGNAFLEFRSTADNNSYQGLLFADNNQGGYVAFNNAGGGDDYLHLGGYTGVKLEYGSQDSTTDIALKTLGMTLNSTGATFAGAVAVTGALSHNGSTVWDAGNDGASSGLDADLLDGISSATFARLDSAASFSSTLYAAGKITSGVNGAAYFCGGDDACLYDVNVANVVGIVGATTDRGYVQFGNGSSAILGAVNGGALTYNGNTVWHSGNDGASSGLDADLLDGVSSGSFARVDAATNFTTAPTISGNTVWHAGNLTNLNQLTNGPGYITDGNSGWDNVYGYITDGNSGWDNAYGYITDGNSGWDNVYGYITGSNPTFSSLSMFSGYSVCMTAQTGGNLGWCDPSDVRLKKEIVPLPTAATIEKLRGLNPVSFKWIDEAVSTSTQIGLIAQETMEFFPELILSGNGPYYGVNYSRLVSPLIVGFQVLDSRTIDISSDGNGNVGIASTSPSATLSVNGTGYFTDNLTVTSDVRATGFVNTSTRTLKTNVSYLSASSSQRMLAELLDLKAATYRYISDSPVLGGAEGLRLGLIAEDVAAIAPELLSLDGKGIDLYKLATFTLAGVQALAIRIEGQETRLTSLEARVAALESGAVSTASGTMLTASSTQQWITSWFASAQNGIGDLLAKTFRASEKICVDDQCLTKDDVHTLLQMVRAQATSTAPTSTTSGGEISIITTASSTPTADAATASSTALITADTADTTATSTPADTATTTTPIEITDTPPTTDTATDSTVVITDVLPTTDTAVSTDQTTATLETSSEVPTEQATDSSTAPATDTTTTTSP